MARVTVEDCIEKVDNRFELVLLSAHRARLISQGSELTVDRDRDKNPIVALREIADATISAEDLKEDLIHTHQRYVDVDEPENDLLPPQDENSSDTSALLFDRMSEDELLRSIDGLSIPQSSTERDDDD